MNIWFSNIDCLFILKIMYLLCRLCSCILSIFCLPIVRKKNRERSFRIGHRYMTHLRGLIYKYITGGDFDTLKFLYEEARYI